jgi:hypothetical protein
MSMSRPDLGEIIGDAIFSYYDGFGQHPGITRAYGAAEHVVKALKAHGYPEVIDAAIGDIAADLDDRLERLELEQGELMQRRRAQGLADQARECAIRLRAHRRVRKVVREALEAERTKPSGRWRVACGAGNIPADQGTYATESAARDVMRLHDGACPGTHAVEFVPDEGANTRG